MKFSPKLFSLYKSLRSVSFHVQSFYQLQNAYMDSVVMGLILLAKI